MWRGPRLVHGDRRGRLDGKQAAVLVAQHQRRAVAQHLVALDALHHDVRLGGAAHFV